MEAHFCGATIELVVPAWRQGMVVLGDLQQANSPRWHEGAEIDAASLRNLMSSDGSLLKAESSGNGTFSFVSRGWNYPFKLSRHSAAMDHAFHCYVILPIDAATLQVESLVTSPPFKVISSHRRIAAAAAAVSSSAKLTKARASNASSSTSTTHVSVSPIVCNEATSSAESLPKSDEEETGGDFFQGLLDILGQSEETSASSLLGNPPAFQASDGLFVPAAPLKLEAGPRTLPSMFRFVETPHEESARRKRNTLTELSYESFLAQVPIEMETFLSECIAGLSLEPRSVPSLPPPPGAILQRVQSANDLQDLLPPGILISMLQNPVPITVDDEIPDIAGRWHLPEDLFATDIENVLADLSTPSKFTGFAKWAYRSFFGSGDTFITGVIVAWDTLELRLPKAVSDSPVRFCFDAEVRDFKLMGPISLLVSMTMQSWVVGPVAICRNQLNEHRRIDRCHWRREDGTLAVLFIYQSLGGQGWKGTVFDRGLALLAGDWVINRVTYGYLRPME